jgi:hypothetical protein
MKLAPFLSVLVAAASMAAPLNAQLDLPDGDWTGNITPPEGTAIGVRYEIANDSVDRRLVIKISEEHFLARDLRVEPGLLHFTWSPGPEVECRLERRELSHYTVYEGTCGDEETGIGRIRMISPPQTSRALSRCQAGEAATRITRAGV